MTVIQLEVFGVKRWQKKLKDMGERSANPSIALEMIYADLLRLEEQIFLSQGRRGGGSWKQLSQETIATKTRKQQDPRINIATGRLMASMSERDHADQIKEITVDTIRFGSTAPGARQSQRNRPIFKLTPFDRKRFARIAMRYIVHG